MCVDNTLTVLKILVRRQYPSLLLVGKEGR